MNTTQRTFARLTGYSLLLMALAAGFSFAYALPKLIAMDGINLSQQTIAEHLHLYQFMLVGLITVLLLDVLVSWTMFQYFKNNHRKLAALSGLLRIVYSVIFGFAIYYLSKNMGADQNYIILENYNTFQTIWSIGLIIFGIHLLVVAVLIKLHKSVPALIFYLTAIAGLSYILIHAIKTVSPHLTELIHTLNSILGFPMAAAELGLAIWLIFKGGKTNVIATHE